MTGENMKAKEYYSKKIRPFVFDDTVDFEDLSLIRKLWIWLMAVRA